MPFKVVERGWGEFILQVTFSFVTGEKMKIEHPLLFEPYYQEHFYKTNILLDQPQVRLNQVPIAYEDSFLRDLGDRLCALNEKEISGIYELMQSFTSSNGNNSDLFVIKSAEPDPSGRQAVALKFNLNSFSVEQLQKICALANFEGSKNINELNLYS
jgi:transcription initiation factor IIF auxiliary subunit